MGPLLSATFVTRPHRFAVEAELDDGRSVQAHLADPGRLRELLLPGAALRLRPAPPGTRRVTAFSAVLVRAADGPWVSVDTGRANRLARELLERGAVEGIPSGGELRAEVRHGDSRFDFVLDPADGPRWWIEVKSVTFVEDGVGLFPDAPTARGRRHVRELTEIARSGERAAVLFVVQRSDATCVRPHAPIDPAFSAALADAGRAGVLLRAAAYRVDGNGRATYAGPLPVHA